MSDVRTLPSTEWPLWRRLIFRFFCIFFVLQIAPIRWLDLPFLYTIIDAYDAAIDSIVAFGNTHFFHIRETLVPLNGSGDTSFAWAELCFFISASALGCLIWSVVDRKRKSYRTADYWVQTLVRYDIILVSFSYGFSKLYLQQMPFPSLSQLMTPLGDLSPMRLAWLFIGYSAPYQMFGGFLEILVGVLLLFRRTQTAGLLLGAAVYLNVTMLNMAYDIPVKLYSFIYFFYCIYLLAHQYGRLRAFFWSNTQVQPYIPYTPMFSKKGRYGKNAVKTIFILLFFGIPFLSGFFPSEEVALSQKPGPIYGVYDVALFVKDRDTITSNEDMIRWQNIVFDTEGMGSLATKNMSYKRRRYGRVYFSYETDTVEKLITMSNSPEDEPFNTFHYTPADSNTLIINNADTYILLKKNTHHYLLADKPFNWLQENVP